MQLLHLRAAEAELTPSSGRAVVSGRLLVTPRDVLGAILGLKDPRSVGPRRLHKWSQAKNCVVPKKQRWRRNIFINTSIIRQHKSLSNA
jgi:hypothetical protein